MPAAWWLCWNAAAEPAALAGHSAARRVQGAAEGGDVCHPAGPGVLLQPGATADKGGDIQVSQLASLPRCQTYGMRRHGHMHTLTESVDR